MNRRSQRLSILDPEPLPEISFWGMKPIDDCKGNQMSGEKTVDNITFRIRHTMMLVSDLERSIDFYTRLLGMDIQRRRDIPEQNERVGYVGYGKEDDGPSLELIESPKTRGKAAPWTGHVALYVSDCYKLCDKLKAEGVEFVSGPGPNRPGSRDIYAFIKDPDGYIIELTERHPKMEADGQTSQ